jgi:histidine triad (HIT) family protein
MTDAACIFCKIIAGEIPAYKVYEDECALAFLDIAPFEKGHVLVVSKRHAPTLPDLPDNALGGLLAAVKTVASGLLANLPCDGFNVLQNNGACASQTIPHVHFHVVPRWNGRPLNWIPGKYDNPAAELPALQAKLQATGDR